MAVQELVEIKFRLADGSDIGPNKYASSTTVASLKDKLIAQWPKGCGISSLLYLIMCIYICVFMEFASFVAYFGALAIFNHYFVSSLV
uniref:NTGP5 n=1 Tax=Solanum tuberosum TaxID=4113 RepID=M1AG26_SOLTU